MSVIELTARYAVADDGMTARLTLAATELDTNDEGEGEPTCLTLIHECFLRENASYDYFDAFSLCLDVHIGESLTIIARRAGRIIGSLVNEIDTSAQARVLLHPKGGFNVLVYQSREQEQDKEASAIHREVAALLADTGQ